MLWAHTLITSWGVDTGKSAQRSDTLATFINIFTGGAVIAQLVSLFAVTLIGAVDVGALLITRVKLTLISIFTMLLILRYLEAGEAQAAVRAHRVLTYVMTHSPWIHPTLIDVQAFPPECVEAISSLTVTAI